jgi:hypothetical protein
MAAATKKEKKRKEEAYPWKAGASSEPITNLKQSILDFTLLCLLFWSGGMPVLLACLQVMSFLPSLLAP